MIHIRRTFAAALLAAGTVIGAASIASAQGATVTPPRTQGQHPRRAHGAHRLGGQSLKGMALSDAEKANLKNVQAKYAPQMKALREQAKPQLQALRDARQRGDTAALRSLRAQAQAQRGQQGGQAKQLFDAQRNDTRASLSPANQAKFDANAARLQKRMANHRKGAGKNAVPRNGTQPRA